jgi:hypothetical protein
LHARVPARASCEHHAVAVFGNCSQRISVTIIPLQSCFELAAPEDFADLTVLQSSGPHNAAVFRLLQASLIPHLVVSQSRIFLVLSVTRYAWVHGSLHLRRQQRWSSSPSLTIRAGNAEPILESVVPTLGPTRGSTVVTITGFNFVDGSTVCRAGLASWSVASCSSPMECVCSVPAHSQGRYPLSVSADGGLTFSKDSVVFLFYCTSSLLAPCSFRLQIVKPPSLSRSRDHRAHFSNLRLRIRSNHCSRVWIELYQLVVSQVPIWNHRGGGCLAVQFGC